MITKSVDTTNNRTQPIAKEPDCEQKIQLGAAEHLRQLIYFAIFGLMSASIYFAILAILIDYVAISSRIAVSIAFILSTLFTFVASRNITFKKNHSGLVKHTKRFIVMLFASYLLTMVIVEIGTSVFNQTVYIGSIVAIFVSMFFRFALSKFWVFT